MIQDMFSDSAIKELLGNNYILISWHMMCLNESIIEHVIVFVCLAMEAHFCQKKEKIDEKLEMTFIVNHTFEIGHQNYIHNT